MGTPSTWISFGGDDGGLHQVHVGLKSGADIDAALLLEVGDVRAIDKASVVDEGIAWMQMPAGSHQIGRYGQIMVLDGGPGDAGEHRSGVDQGAQRSEERRVGKEGRSRWS